MRSAALQIVVLAILASAAVAHAQSLSPPAVPAHPSIPETASLTPGTIINSDNADRYANYISAAAMLAVHHGFRIEVTPTHRLQWSAGFQTATEKYSPQVGLDKDDYVANYI